MRRYNKWCNEKIDSHIETREMYPKMNKISRFGINFTKKCAEKSFSKIDHRKISMI
jgi:hypothetical protein